MPRLDNEGQSIISRIKAAAAQLEDWHRSQTDQARRRQAANASYPGGFGDRLERVRFRTLLDSAFTSVYCNFCECDEHSTQDCQARVGSSPSETVSLENPSLGIHRAIVHRLYLSACELYLHYHPRFYTGPIPRTHRPEVLPVPLSGPDYLVIAINQTASELQSVPGFISSDVRNAHRRRRLSTVAATIAGLYYSKAFRIDFEEFCTRVADKVQENLEDESEDESE
jgi:hypothetical protein